LQECSSLNDPDQYRDDGDDPQDMNDTAFSEAIVWDNSIRFSERTFIRMMTRITQVVMQVACQQVKKGDKFVSVFNNRELGA
jgi:hypothetical protein